MKQVPAGTAVSFHKSGSREAARYVSGSAVYEEALEHGRLIGLYWSATGQVQRENVTTGLPGMSSLNRPVHVFELEIDGQSLHNRWDWEGASPRPGRRPGTVEAVVALRHQVRPVSLKVVTRLDGSPVLVRYLEITNTGTQPAALAAVCPACGVLWNTNTDREGHYSHANPGFDGRGQAKYTLGYMASQDALQEGNFVWQPLPPEGFRVERAAHGKSWGSPYYIVRNEPTGEMFFLGLAWSANFYAEFSHCHGSLLAFRMGPLAPAPLRVIAPGETVTSPEVHLGPVHGDMDSAVGQWYAHMRASVIPPRPRGREMYTVAGRVVEEPGEWILREIDIAAEMGVEAFMVDAGWYGATFGGWTELRGDWDVGNWMPGGLAGVREYAKERGLLFGLWHEAETVSDKAQLRKRHPNWMLTTDKGRQVAEGLSLASPEAARFLEETVVRLVREHRLDFYKLDYNISPGEGGQTVQDGFAESEYWRHFEALNRTYDRVLAEFPDVCLENCASGGGRNDLAMLSRFHYASESDWSVMPFSIRAINAMTLFVPPEALCYYHNHVNWMGVQAHQLADADTHLRVTLFALPIFVGFGGQNADRSTEFYRTTRRYIELNKGFCRPVMARHPAVYHHTPDIGLFAPADWCVLEYAAHDRSRGYAGLFKLSPKRDDCWVFRARGVDLGVQYRVTLDNGGQAFSMSGRDLGLTGIPVRLDSALTSELVLYEREPPA